MAAANNYSIDLGLPSVPPTEDTNLYVQLKLVYDAINLLASSTQSMVNTATTRTVSMKASENIPAGVFVNFYNGQVRIADAYNSNGPSASAMSPCLLASTDRPVHGFSSKAISSGKSGTILLPDSIITFSSSILTLGDSYWLSAYGNTPTTAAGKIYQGPPSSSGFGYLRQLIGIALSTTQLYFKPNLDPYYW